MTSADALGRARAAWKARAWARARDAFTAADAAQPLAPNDLQCLATAAYLSGDDPTSISAWSRAYRELMTAGDLEGAARCSVWQAFQLLTTGEGARGGGWLTRAQRLLDECGRESAVRGFVQALTAVQVLQASDPAGALAGFAEAIRIGQRFGDRDVETLGRLGQGQALIQLGQPAEGMALLDDVMVAVTASEVSPVVAGLAYCAVIDCCRENFDLSRAAQWTAALSEWCGAQPELVAYRGHCQVHRSEVLQMRGAWAEAMREVRRGRPRRGLRRPAHSQASNAPACVQRRSGIALQVLRSDALRDDHAPRVDDEFAQVLLVQRGQPDLHPVVALIDAVRRQERVRIGCHQRVAFVARVGEAHHRLVAGEREVDDAPDLELEPVTHHRLVRPRERSGNSPHIVDRCHIRIPTQADDNA
jgi:hypothetical protein